MITIPTNYSCFEYRVIFNVPSYKNDSNATLNTYEIRTRVGTEFVLAFFFLFLTVCLLITTGVKIFTYYAKRRSLFKEKESHIEE